LDRRLGGPRGEEKILDSKYIKLNLYSSIAIQSMGNFVGSELLKTVDMESANFWDETPSALLGIVDYSKEHRLKCTRLHGAKSLKYPTRSNFDRNEI
jgi:hypothetical protein